MGRKCYVDTGYGQVHLVIHAAAQQAKYPPLVCLHPIPYSAVYYDTLVPRINAGRDVIIPDYPGYGGSDFYREAPSVNDYAMATGQAVAALGLSGAVDLLGFHIGALVAPEFSLCFPQLTRRMALVDVPYFKPQERAGMLQKFGLKKETFSPELDCLAGAWDFNITRQTGAVPLARCFELFVEQLRAGENANGGYHAAFTWPCETRFPEINARCLVIATDAGLYAHSVEAAGLIPGCELAELPALKRAVFETGTEEIAALVNTFLDN